MTSFYYPRTWLRDSITNADGGIDAIAAAAEIPVAELERICAGEPTMKLRAFALARTLQVPVSLLFHEPETTRSPLRKLLVGSSIGVGVLVVLAIAAMAGLYWLRGHQDLLPKGWTKPASSPTAPRHGPRPRLVIPRA